MSCRIPLWPSTQRIIGLVGPESGDHSDTGISIVDGALFRAYEINKNDAVLPYDFISVVHYDDMGNSEKSIAAVKRLIEVDEAIAVIYYNPDKETSGKCADLCNKADIPFISLNGCYDRSKNPVSAGGYELSMGDTKVSQIGLDYMFADLGIINPALIVIGDEPIPADTRAIIDKKIPPDVTLAFDERVGRTDIELISVSTELKFSGADAVLVYAMAEDTFRLVRELEVDQVNIPIINIKPFTEPGIFDNEITLGSFVYFFTPLPTGFAGVKTERFQRHFLEIKGYEPNYYSALGYEAVDFITYPVIEKRSFKTETMTAEWNKMSTWDGIVGDTNMKTGQTNFKVYVYKVSIIEGIPIPTPVAEL